MLEKLSFALRDRCAAPDGRLLVGLSGGADSLSLLHGLQRLGCNLVAAHLDHGLRPEAPLDAEYAASFAADLGVPLVTERIEVAPLARLGRISLEEAAREARYGFLFRAAEACQASAVAVAHTADDQAETVLMHLLRGAGPGGLGGMTFRSLPNPWSATIPLLRPLLGVWRSEIEAYVAANDLHPRQDASNLDRRFYRNRLRHETLPYLESLNPGFRRRLWQTADLLREEEAIVSAAADAAWDDCTLPDAEAPGDEAASHKLRIQPGSFPNRSVIALHAARLRLQPPAIQRRLLRRAIAALRPGLRDIDYAAIQRVLGYLVDPPKSGQADLIAGLRMVFNDERLIIADWQAVLPEEDSPQVPHGVVSRLAVPGELALPPDPLVSGETPVLPGESAPPSGWRLSAELFLLTHELRLQAAANPDPFCAWLDLERLTLPLTIRSRRPGDRFRPLGMGGHSMKLADFMINRGLPRPARDTWPLVVSDEEIAWVPGYQIADTFALREGSRRTALFMMTKV